MGEASRTPADPGSAGSTWPADRQLVARLLFRFFRSDRLCCCSSTRRSLTRLAGRRTGAATETETLELPRGQRVEAAFVEIPERIGADGAELLIREVERRTSGEELHQDRVGGAARDRTAHRARLARPGDAERCVEPQQGERRDQPDRKRKQNAEVVRAVPAVASARLGAPACSAHAIRHFAHAASDEGDATEGVHEVARLLDCDAGDDHRVTQLAKVANLAPDQ
jgi:hypothetical protein